MFAISYFAIYVMIYCVSCIFFEVKVLSEGVLWDLLSICSVVNQPAFVIGENSLIGGDLGKSRYAVLV